ncbi:YcxB family protein [Dactylosporangium darangshiense]|uniref:YcxB-like protein domain-containing protein n=1 Tax=Dactylosporangium darangshiense TaxID=579108 RepID=A0ABP8DT85_9ACTN
MHITLTVQPDSGRTRRSLRARMRGGLRSWNLIGGGLSAAGLGALLLGAPVGGGVMLTPGVVMLVGPWLLTRAAANARTGVFVEIATYELTDDAVRVRTPSLRAGYKWSTVERVEDNGEFWVVVTGGTGVLVLPWTLLPAVDVAQARDFLRQRGLLVAV